MGIEMVMHVVQRVSFWWKTMFLCREGGGGGGFAANKIWEVPQVNLLGKIFLPNRF